MALTVAETVRELERLKHQRAVWMDMIERLARCVDKESKKADHGIAAEGCVTNPVPQKVVREFIDRINDEEIEPLNQQILSLENLSVKEEGEEEDGSKQGDQKQKKKSKAKKGTLKKRRVQGRSKTNGPQGRVRTIPRAAEHKN